jgi:hypothetical protein
LILCFPSQSRFLLKSAKWSNSLVPAGLSIYIKNRPAPGSKTVQI